MTARSSSAPASSPSSVSPGMARPESLSGSPAISRRALTRSIWCASPPKRSAARAAAAGPIWRRPAVPMAPRRGLRSRRSKKRWLAPEQLSRIQKGRDDFSCFLARHDGADLECHAEALTVQDPLLKQPQIVAFHQLKAAVEVGLDPAPDIAQPFRKFYPGLAHALVDRNRVPVFETLED